MRTIERETSVEALRKFAEKCKEENTAKKAAKALRQIAKSVAISTNICYRVIDCVDTVKVRKLGRTIAEIAKDPENGFVREPAYYEKNCEEASLAIEGVQASYWTLATISGSIATSVEEAEMVSGWFLNTLGKVTNVVADIIERAPYDSPDGTLAKICDVAETEVFAPELFLGNTTTHSSRFCELIQKAHDGVRYKFIVDTEEQAECINSYVKFRFGEVSSLTVIVSKKE